MEYHCDDISPQTSPRPSDDRDCHLNPASQQTEEDEGEDDIFLNTPIAPISSAHVEDPTEVLKSSEDVSPSTRLYRSTYVLLLTLLYMGFAIFAWTVTCILSLRPITANHYGAWIWDNNNNGYGASSPKHLQSLYVKNENWFRTARVIQALVGVLTIPVTSAVCSAAAVVFVQRNGSRSDITIRKVMTLADKCWTDPPTYLRTFPYLVSKGWKRYGTSFLFLAMFLCLLGGAISPLQQVFLTTITIKTPTWPQVVEGLVDIPDQFYGERDGTVDSNLVVVLTRVALSVTTNTEPQAQMWQSGPTCNLTSNLEPGIPIYCGTGATFGTMQGLDDPYLAQLPSGFSTGLLQQFIPRINSSASYEQIEEDDFPSGCGSNPGKFHVTYSNITGTLVVGGNLTFWGLEACMPANMTVSPWKSTRARQDFGEELFLNLSKVDLERVTSNYSYYRITVNTTGGYFELPNYMNGEVQGPLLEFDPNEVCGNACEAQGNNLTADISDHGHSISDPRKSHQASPNTKLRSASSRKVRRQPNSTDESLLLENVFNKGPLLTIALALFGEGSFIDTRLNHPSAYAGMNYTYESGFPPKPTNEGACVDLVPLGFLLDNFIGQIEGANIDYCITNIDGEPDGSGVADEVVSWMSNFKAETGDLTNAFNAAAFLANQAWLLNQINAGVSTLTVSYDLGDDLEIPQISLAGMILISMLLGLDLAMLLALAIYASAFPRWTAQLDSFAMLRLGAAIGERMPLLVGRRTNRIDVLDKLPGWVGDEADIESPIGKLCLGAKRAVTSERRYESYQSDNEPLSSQERARIRERWKALREGGVTGAGEQMLGAIGIRS